MKEESLNKIMYAMMIVGAIIALTGVGLIVFTDIYINRGVDGVLIIAALIATGLFLLLPAKIYLTLQLMKKNDEKLKMANQARESGEP